MTVEESVRLQLKEEIGDDENITQPQKAALLQKYGLIKPVLFITNGDQIVVEKPAKPSWIEEEAWDRNKWKNLVNQALTPAISQ